MKTGILITARLGSTRLKRKHLLSVRSYPILFYLIKRITLEFKPEINNGKIKLIIATSDEPENREFESFSKYGVIVFYGSSNNIPLRHLETATYHDLDNLVSVDGDDIMCSVKGMRCIYDALNKGANYVKTENLPFGMNSCGYKRTFLESSLQNYVKDVLETGWGRIFDSNELTLIQMPFGIHNDLLRFTLDYQEDFTFFKDIIENLGENIFIASDKAIVEIALNRESFKLNEAISREYWDNFYKKMEEEKQNSVKSLVEG